MLRAGDCFTGPFPPGSGKTRRFIILTDEEDGNCVVAFAFLSTSCQGVDGLFSHLRHGSTKKSRRESRTGLLGCVLRMKVVIIENLEELQRLIVTWSNDFVNGDSQWVEERVHELAEKYRDKFGLAKDW